MEIIHDPEGCNVVEKKNKEKQEDEDEDPEQAQEQGHHQLVAADYQDNTKSSSMQPLPVASCSDQGNDEMRVATNASAAASAAASSSREKYTVEAANRSGRTPPRRPRHWWGDCAPNVALLREALLSSAPDIAVLGPLHGCFAFYVSHLHNEVLSSTYARTMTLGPNVTRLEAAFMWVGGWRPTSALVLVYSLMGIEIENALQTVSAGRDVGACSTSALLSSRQLSVMHTLQKHTQHAEMKISKKLTVLQMLIGDQDVLVAVLLDAASPLANDSSRFNLVAAKRMSRFRRLLGQAEELRLHTLKDLLSLLTPIQAARCGVAVFEMCSSFRTMGTTLLPRLPTLAMSSLPVVAIRPKPAPPSSLALDRLLVVAGVGEPVVSDLSSSDLPKSSDVPLCQFRELLVSDFSSSDNNILNSSGASVGQSDERPLVSDVSSSSLVSDFSSSDNNILSSPHAPVSQSDERPLVFDVSSSSEILNASDVLLSHSDETAHLVPSCSNSSSSDPLPQDSSRDLLKEERIRSLSTIDRALLKLELHDATTDGIGRTTGEQQPLEAGNTEHREVVSNRLLLLSPVSSDVSIQNCSLDTAELGPYFEMHPQLPPTSDDRGEEPHQGQPRSSESGDIGDSWQIQTCSRPISVLCECAQQGSQLKEGKEVKFSSRE